jgi:ribonuclease J
MRASVTVLGGVGEIGMNMYVYETDDTAVIVDCGVMFADYTFPGVDYIIPDFEYIENIKHKLAAVLVSHGHEDHIGGLPYLLARFNIPVYGGKLGLGILASKLGARKEKYKLITVESREALKIGDFHVSFIPVTHSIADTFAIYVKSGPFSALHCSDFKIDYTPVSGEPFREEDFSAIGDKSLTCLLIDSTNAMNEGFTDSESTIKRELKDIVCSSAGRVFFTTFSSNLEVAEELGRKVVIEGASIERNVEIAKKLGYLEAKPKCVVQLSTAKKLPDNKVIYIITGCQGEMHSTLYRVASRERKDLKVEQGDTFIISARVIPGNEKSLNRLINLIYENGGEVVDIATRHVHVSGHASRGELTKMLKLTRPSYVVPVHGEEMHLAHQRMNAMKTGMFERERIIPLKDGMKGVFEGGKLTDVDEVPHGAVYIDLRGKMVIDDELLKDRKSLCRDGAVAVTVVYDSFREKTVTPPVIRAKGFRLDDHQIFELRKFLNDNLSSLFEEAAGDYNIIEDYIEKLVRRYFRKSMDRRPAVAASVVEV